MNLLEHQGKYLFTRAGVRVPRGEVVSTPTGAAEAATRIGGRVVCKAQIPTGKRGKAGAVQLVDTPAEASAFAERMLGTQVGGYDVCELVVEEVVDIAREFYAAVLDDPASKGPLVLFSTEGGMDIEEVSTSAPELVHRALVDVQTGLDETRTGELLIRTDLDPTAQSAVAQTLMQLYSVYRDCDASLVEINPLVLTRDGSVTALDAKITIDPDSIPRQQELLDQLPGGPPILQGTELELRGRELCLQYIELDGDVGVLANGAGLAMTTLDAVTHFGGSPANFLEIGGDAYTKATLALELVLSNPRVKSLLVNFCGAFARTDVMAEGVVNAIQKFEPTLPIAFTIHGTGEDEAIALVRDRLGVEPYDLMDDAIQAAVNAAREISSAEATA